MKPLLATLFFLLESVLLIVGTAMAANGRGMTVLVVALVIMGGLFVKFGCLDNAPSDHH